MAPILSYRNQLLQPTGARDRPARQLNTQLAGSGCEYQSRLMRAAKALKVSSCAARKERVSSSTS